MCKGYTDERLRKEFRHGFSSLVDAANSKGFGLIEIQDLQTIDLIDNDGNYLRTRYHRRGAFTSATLESINSTAAECAILSCQRLRKYGLVVRTPQPALEWRKGLPF